MAAPSASGRRAAAQARSRLGLPVLLAVAVPLVTALAALGVQPPPVQPREPGPPTLAALNRADLACPRALPGTDRIRVLATAGAGGPLAVGPARGRDAERTEVRVRPDRTASTRAPGSTFVVGRDELAPGLVGSRAGGRRTAATACAVPGSERWFTGLGASSEARSVVELANPDPGAAVVDLQLWSPRGPVSAPGLRGLSVPGRQVLRLDLSQEVPRDAELALRVLAARGRVASTVSTVLDPVGRGEVLREWIPGQQEPAEVSLLPGLAAGPGPRTLLLLNPGEDEARVDLRLVNESSTFAPTAAEQIRVPAGEVARVPLPWLRRELSAGASALRVESSAPVTATLRGEVDGDLVATAPVPAVEETGAAALPGGPATLVLAGAEDEGTARVVVADADADRVRRRTVDLAPGTAVEQDLPDWAASVRVEPQGTTLVGAVLLGGGGTAVLPVLQTPRAGLVPAVRPALP